MKIDFTKILKSRIDFAKLLRMSGIKTLAGLTGVKGWLVNIFLNKVWKQIYPPLKLAWNLAIDKIRDAKLLDNYTDEMVKGKDADDQKLHDAQDAILNPHKSRPK